MTLKISSQTRLITIIKSTISPDSKLPLKAIQGTEAERYRLAKSFSNQLQKGLEIISSTKQCKTDDFLNLINNIVAPYKIQINIKPLKKRWINLFEYLGGAIEQDFDISSKLLQEGDKHIDITQIDIKGYNIHLNLSKNNKIIKNKYSALHEARHLFDHICNPKTVDLKASKLINNTKQITAYNNAREAFINGSSIFNLWKENGMKYLSELSDESVIDCLQEIRNTYKTEINAYQDTLEFMSKHRFKNLFSIIGTNDAINSYDYQNRLKFVNKLLADKLKLLRSNFIKLNGVICKSE